MASGDVHDDVFLELSESVREVNLYIEELSGKMIKLYREKTQMENVQKRLIEISMEYDKSGQKEKDGVRTRLNELKTQFYNIKDSSSPNLDLGVATGSGGAGASQNDDQKREKEQLEAAEKEMHESLKEYHQSDDSGKDGFKKFRALVEYDDVCSKIEQRNMQNVEDVSVVSGRGGAGPSQDVGARMSGQGQGGRQKTSKFEKAEEKWYAEDLKKREAEDAALAEQFKQAVQELNDARKLVKEHVEGGGQGLREAWENFERRERRLDSLRSQKDVVAMINRQKDLNMPDAFLPE